MKKNTVFLKAAGKAAGLPAVLLALGLAASVLLTLAGCDNGGGGGEEGLNLPPIDEQTTGRLTITGDDIALEAGKDLSDGSPVLQTFVNGLDLPGETDNSVTWSVDKGKLTFSLGTPSQLNPLTAEMIKSMGEWTNIEVNPTDVQVSVVEKFEFEKPDGVKYNVERQKLATDGNTYYRTSQIIYVYVSKDVTASGQKETDEDGDIYNAFNYSLKTGWNLIQMDSYSTRTSTTVSIGIAAKNIPWTVNKSNATSSDPVEEDGGGGQPNTLIIENISAEVYSDGVNGQIGILPAGTPEEDAFEQQEELAVAGVNFSDGNIEVAGSGPYTLTIPLHVIGDNKTPWTGSGPYDVYVVFIDGEGPRYYKFASVVFFSANIYVVFSDAAEVFHPSGDGPA
jgi:hypothetical protein